MQGTVVGALAAALLIRGVFWMRDQAFEERLRLADKVLPYVLVLPLVFSMAFFKTNTRITGAVLVALITPYVMLLDPRVHSHPSDTQDDTDPDVNSYVNGLIFERLWLTSIGVLACVAVELAVLPASLRTMLREQMADNLDNCALALDEVISASACEACGSANGQEVLFVHARTHTHALTHARTHSRTLFHTPSREAQSVLRT